jgi:hypothetical protein
MPTRANITIADHENEKSNVLIWVQDVGAVNYGSVTQDIDELKDAIATISRGTILDAGFSKVFPEATGYPADDPEAQREAKWLITYQDTLQFLDEANTIANPGYLKVFNTEIPCADLSLLPEGKEELDLVDGGVVAAFVASFEANARSPYNHTHGKTSPPASVVKVLSIRHAGRRS